MKIDKKEETKIIDVSFDIAILLKSLFAIGEVIGGLALFFLTPARMNGIISWFTRGELREDPKDLISNLIVHFGQNFTVNAQYLAAIYLLSHGLIKLITLILLWKKILWAYPLSILVFLGFIVYQLNEFAHTHSIFMIFVTLVDILMIILTVLEYRNIKAKNKETSSV